MNNDTLDSDYITAALPAFISEAQEQLEMLEQLLLQLEDRPDDRELLDALFRCAHTIKGSAGIFGLDDVVAFTHHVETLLDAVRQGRVTLTPALSTLLLQSTDQVRQLVEAATAAPAATVADGQPAPTEADTQGLADRAALVQQLQAASGDAPSASTGASTPPAPARQPHWHIAVRFHADTFRNGMDPLAILNYVAKLGTLRAVALALDDIPDLGQLDPESCHLDFQLALESDASRSEIEAAFSFVRDDCTLQISEPQPVDMAARIEALPDNHRLGDILIAAGAVSRAQLQQALQAQTASAESGSTAPPLGQILHQQSGLRQQVVAAALNKQAKPRQAAVGGAAGAGAAAGNDNRYIRVQADRLDAVINLLGELVIAGAGAALLARQTRSGALIEANDQIGQLIEEIRNGTLQLRMVPIGETFSRFRRVVRDTAAELKKDVVLEIVGAETELDKSVVERIADPLMHLVRNALDHGLETPAEREAAGKRPQGTLTLSACHESGSILIRIRDDGRGIQRDKVLARAWERGIVERGIVPPDDEVLKLIFEAGFSTAEKVTNLSGRGVGMDVVRSNIEALRGSVNLSSEAGQGSCIEIRLPLTLAIIDGFLVGVGASRFILPLDGVVEVIENRPSQPLGLDGRGCSTVELRGQVLPVVSLRTLYAIDSAQPERSSIVVVQAGNRRFGVMVDQLHGQHQTVIKPLARMFRSLRGISGSSILGNGEVALIFDVASLSQMAADASDSVSRSPRGPGVAGRPAPTLLEG